MVCKKILLLLSMLPLWIPAPLAFSTAEDPSTGNQESCNTIEYYYRLGCPHCYKAKIFLDQLRKEYPGIVIRFFNVLDKGYGEKRFIELNNQHEIQQPGVPSFYVCDQFIVGYSSPGSTGKRIKDILELDKTPSVTPHAPLEEPTLLGGISVKEYGLPLFTIVIGLVDGFNPCAMWVLLFLLALLVNLRSRMRIFIVAGTFVLISGLIYFAFMAAWLNLFLVIGISRGLQIVVGLVAILVGATHIKDYFAYKKGISLSIPETSKPGIYARMRKVIYAENLWASLAAVMVLAILVNLVELMCTAGLPAAYTQILTLKSLPKLEYYAYLALYNIAYIFDDALMVTIVVYTLKRTRLQEKAGRVLKLISGTVIVALGTFLVFFPDRLL